MRDKLQNEIMLMLIGNGIDTDSIKSKLTIILNEYEIEQRQTEIAIVNEDDIPKYIRLFLINKKVAGRTDRTIQQYKAELERFFREVQKSPLEITSDDIKLFLAKKEVRDNVSKVYQSNILRVLSSFYQWMIKEEYLLKNPMNKIDEIKVPKVKKDAFTETQIEQMRMNFEDDLRLMCIFELLLSAWCRVSEIAQIKLSDISETMENILIHGKGSKDRICYINARAKIIMQKYMSERQDENEYLFPNCKIKVNDTKCLISVECKKRKVSPKDWWKEKDLVGDGHIDKSVIETMIRKLGKRSGVDKAHPHRFRRTGATFALRRGMPIEQVSKILGHESIETTQIYLDISEKELEQAHRKYV